MPEEHVAATNVLVVSDQDFGHEPRYVWSDRNNLGPHPAVTRPRRVQVIIPEGKADDGCKRHHRQSDGEANGQGQQSFCHQNWTARKTIAPSRTT